MYRLAVVAGPNRGSTYPVMEGETTIGRQNGNVIVLSSAKVSKRHCVLIYDGSDVRVRDQGSSNGTFVNGALVKEKGLQPGDRVSVGEFVFELVRPATKSTAVPIVPVFEDLGQVHPFSGGGSGHSQAGSIQGQAYATHSDNVGYAAPSDLAPAMDPSLKGKLLWAFENKLMPFFYGLILKNEWRVIYTAIVTSFVLLSLLISLQPLLDSNQKNLNAAIGQRAQLIARQIADRNAPYLAAQAETRVDTFGFEREAGVRVAVLTDLELRILAPGTKVGQYLNYGPESTWAAAMKGRFAEGRETGMIKTVGDQIVTAIEPIKVIDPQRGQNVVVGMAVVSIDAKLALRGMGEMGVIYSETLLWTGVIGFLLFFVLYRLTLKPFQVLNGDMDRVLKGELPQVTHEFKLSELNSLWEVINSAIQRIPKSVTHGIGEGSGAMAVPFSEEGLAPLRTIAQASDAAWMICDQDRKILYLNEVFENATGIRPDNSLGREISEVARDQSLGSLITDLFDRCLPGGEGVSEDYEFSGVNFRLTAAAVGTSGSPRAYFIYGVKSE